MIRNRRKKLANAVMAGNERGMRSAVNDLLRAKPFARVVGMIENMYRHGMLLEGKEMVLRTVEKQSMKKGSQVVKIGKSRDRFPITSAA